MNALFTRWLKFNTVGAMGICVQMLAVYLFGAVWKISSLWTTAVAVEAAVLHNFFWHEHFTWSDRHDEARDHALRRLLAFNSTTGAVSIGGNLFFVWLFMRQFRAPLLAANLFAVAVCSLINFIVNDKIIFSARFRDRRQNRARALEAGTQQRYFAGLLVCFLILAPAERLQVKPGPDEGDRIKIHVINSRNGKPLKNVFVALTGPAGGFLKNHEGKVVAGTTNKFGEVTLELPSPVSERFGVSYTGGGTCQLLQCSGAQTYGIAEIVETGVVGINKCSSGPKQRYNLAPKPGELIIFAKPYTGWQCVVQEIP